MKQIGLLEHSLLITGEREHSGSDTIKRYEFQKNFSIQLLIQLYEEQEDFVLMLEFHDDLLVLDSSDKPKNMDFYQVKSKNTGDWDLSKLLYCQKDRNSYLGKMYINKIKFPKYTRKLTFVTNARYKVLLENGRNGLLENQIKCSELCEKEKKLLHEKIEKEFGDKAGIDFENITNLYVTEFTVDSSQTHCIGLLAQLIESISPGVRLNSTIVYNNIYDYIKRKSGNIFDGIDEEDISENELKKLIKLKGITKSDFYSILKALGVWKDPMITWGRIEKALWKCTDSPLVIKSYETYWNTYRNTLIAKRENIKVFNEVSLFINEVIGLNSESTEWKSLNLISFIEKIQGEILINKKFTDLGLLYSESIIKGLILNTIYDE